MTTASETGDVILQETTLRIGEILGSELANLTVERAVLGIFFTGVKLSNGMGGICFTPIKAIPQAVCCPSSARAMPHSGKLAGESVLTHINRLTTGGPLQRALSIAVLNALSATCWNKLPPQDYQLRLGIDPVDETPLPPNKEVVVIGALVPYIKMLKQRGNVFSILEMDPRTLKQDEMRYYCPPEKAEDCLARADLVIITGTTLLTNTLEGILACMKPAGRAILVGPTASMLPESFFARGVQAIGGIMVTDADLLLNTLAEAGSGYHFYGHSAERLVIDRRPS